MAKLTAVLVTILGIWLLLGAGVLNVIPASILELQPIIIAVVVTIIGIGKLMRSFK